MRKAWRRLRFDDLLRVAHAMSTERRQPLMAIDRAKPRMRSQALPEICWRRPQDASDLVPAYDKTIQRLGNTFSRGMRRFGSLGF